MGVLTNALVPSKCLDGTKTTDLSFLQKLKRESISWVVINGMSWGNTTERKKPLLDIHESAKLTALLTPDSSSSQISIQLNFLPILNTSSSFETRIIFSIHAESATVCKTYSNITLENIWVFSEDSLSLVFALENDFIGIIAQVFKLTFNLF